MDTTPVMLRCLILMLAVWLVSVGGCAGESERRAPWTRANADPDDPAVLVNNHPLAPHELRARTAELAGRIVIEELALERELDSACAARGIVITQSELDYERAVLVDAILVESPGSTGNSQQLLDRIRSQRGLGPIRFEALLRRNAMLRALVHQEVRVGSDEVELAHAINTDARAEGRLIVLPTRMAASESIRRVRARAIDLGIVQAFADEARAVSIHPTASDGGWMGELSPLDPALPDSIRATITQAPSMELTPMTKIGQAYGYLLIERQIAGDAENELNDARRAQIRQELTIRKERLEMERRAQQILRETDIHVVDPALGWAFRNRSGIEQ